MLVLTRKPHERMRIVVKVLAVRGKRVKLGITCPDEVRGLRLTQ